MADQRNQMKQNKGFIGIGLIIAIVLGIAVVGGGAYYLGKSSKVENKEIVENNTVQNKIEGSNSHEVPTGPFLDETNYVAPKPLVDNKKVDTVNPTTVDQCPGIKITSPISNSQIKMPLVITGIIHPKSNPKDWTVFEGNAGTVVVKYANGVAKSLPQIINLKVDWMNGDPKPFTVTIPSLTKGGSANEDDPISLSFIDDNVAFPEGTTHTCVMPLKWGY